ncbi:MAG: glycosyltransferase family 4 protein [Sedimentisphaerales bacterium]|nr:glycosyltransferase family 4 protein [Sedimentisphaerales bacterium]
MARRWVVAGHAVTVICGRGDICGLPDQRVFDAEGIHVRVVGSCYSQKQSFLRRIAAFLFFILAGSIEGLCVRNVDVLFATSTPLTIGIPAMVLKWLKGVPFVFEVRDQWPEVPIEMGYIKNMLLKKLLLWLERCIYKSAAAIVALSPGMADGIQIVLGHVKRPVIVAPNGADIELFQPDIDSSAVRKKMGWQDKFVVLHFGAMGKVNSLDFLIDAAQKMQTYPDVLFVLMGQGKEKQNLTEKVAALNLKNLEIHGPTPKSELPRIVAACDVSTVIIGNHPIIEHNSANKFFDSLAAGKPVLLNYSGWQRLTIEAHQAGFGCRLCDLDDYIKNLLTLYTSNNRLRDMGSNARRLAEEEFSRDKIALDVLGVINGVVNS